MDAYTLGTGLTLDAALAVVAARGFYEDTAVMPDPDNPGRFVAEATSAHLDDGWTWTYEDGVRDQDSAGEVSRLFDPSETIVTAGHVRYNLPDTVVALERGARVDFAYALVYDADVTWDEDKQQHYDADGHPADDIAGWVMASNIWED